MDMSANVSDGSGRVDFLTATIDSLRVGGRVLCRLEGRAPWAVEAPAGEVATFHAIERGTCFLRVPEKKRPMLLGPGDVVVLPRGKEHTLGDHPSTIAEPFLDVQRRHDPARSWTMRTGGRGARASIICGAFHFDRSDSSALLSVLPPVLRVPAAGPHAGLVRATLMLIAHEGDTRLRGSDLAVARLTDTLLVHLLRHWIAEQPAGKAGWLAALRDPRIGRALASMHDAPLYAWSLPSLAAKAGMSRTAFAIQFASLVGEPPHALPRSIAARRGRAAAPTRQRPDQ